MAVAVNRDLTVQVLADANVVKLMDSKQALRSAVQRGEPKCLGVSQLMLGLLIMIYSIPLLLVQHSLVVWTGVAWWSGISFVVAGVAAILLEKYCTMNNLFACVVTSGVSVGVSIMAVIIYSVDIGRNPETPCVPEPHDEPHDGCDLHYATKVVKGMKSALLIFTLAQAVISGVLAFLLFRQRHNFQLYNPLHQDTISTQAVTDEN